MSAPNDRAPLASLDKAQTRARAAKRAVATSDQTRVRQMAVAAIVATIGAAAAIALTSGEARAPGPLARPHVVAKLECASCHAQPGLGARDACATCHAAQAHVSTRPAHRALAASGRLGCATCHPAHGAAEGVTFFGDGTYARWIGDRETRAALPTATPLKATVPLVAATVCGTCHDRADPRDPAAACLTRDVDTCFDEHHASASRFVAWDAARGIALDSHAPSAPSAPPSRAPWTWIGAALAACGASLVLFKRRAPRIASAPILPPPRARLPRIDTSTCLGCYACVDACPFDVLEIQRYVAVVARPRDCCGVILCAQACPNASLQIDEGETLADRPRLDAHLESLDAPGVFLAGDLTGLPLIKNAINQGARVVDRIASLPRNHRAPQDADLVVIGAGPAGISAMLRAKERGLRAICLEQGALAASIRSFPRNKIVHDPPLDLPVEGALWLREGTKEALIAQWSRIVRVHGLHIREEQRVTAIARDGGDHLVTAVDRDGASQTLRAARILLAIGKRGTPRTLPLDLTPDVASKVSYALADARSFAGAHVLVVGLGDAAMEAAIALARQPDTTVTVSYRGPDFTRGKARNIAELRALAAAGKVRIAFGSEVTRVAQGSATLTIAEKAERIPNDAVLVLIGGAASWDLVRAAGVRMYAPSPQIVPIENLLARRP